MERNAMSSSALGGARALRIMPVLRMIFLALCKIPGLLAAPVEMGLVTFIEEDLPKEPTDPTLWIYLSVATGLVLLGGAFAGLTIALMGQDEIYLEVIRTSGDGSEQKHAARVLRLLKRGKHWVLVTLLLGNVITNETLPIVLDRSLGGGWPAVLSSTVAIVIFGEIIPQSICVRYGLPIGAYLSPLVLGLMYLFFPVAWPTAKLLDWLLGEDHGTTYKKAGLKTLVTLHKTLGAAGEQLNQDEVTIISAVLDLKEKPVGSIMTPIKDVFTMSEDTVLDEKTTDVILHAGYSRIPIYAPGEPTNFVGMLLVKILIPYDPEDCKKVKDFSLATLPETYPNTSCLDIVNYFQEGKSHMMLVSENPGTNHGALGVVTLEDVMEELIGEEIIDETDNATNVSKALRQPENRYQSYQGKVVTDPVDNAATADENLIDLADDQKEKPEAVRRRTSIDASLYQKALSSPSKPSPGTVRRTSSIAGASDRGEISRRGENPERRERFKNIGPMNPASRPRQTRYNTVKIKAGTGSLGDLGKKKEDIKPVAKRDSISQSISQEAQSGVGEGLLSSAGKDAKDGVHAVQTYGTIGNAPRTPTSPVPPKTPESKTKNIEININTNGSSKKDNDRNRDVEDSDSTIGSLRETVRISPSKRAVRSGSITENIIDAGGIKKVVISLSGSSSETDKDKAVDGEPAGTSEDEDEGKENNKPDGAKSGKKKRRRRRKKGGAPGDAPGEDKPLLDGDD